MNLCAKHGLSDYGQLFNAMVVEEKEECYQAAMDLIQITGTDRVHELAQQQFENLLETWWNNYSSTMKQSYYFLLSYLRQLEKDQSDRNGGNFLNAIRLVVLQIPKESMLSLLSRTPDKIVSSTSEAVL